jgi:hypothetical protein
MLVVFLESKLESMLIFLSGFGIVGGIRLLNNWRYWNKPENRERGREYAEMQQTEEHDEMKAMLRDKAGHCAHTVSMYTSGVAAVLLAVLDKLEIVDAESIILVLGGFLCLQAVAEAVAYRILLDKYSE